MPQRYNVLSPHLDDAALSCALFLAANPGSRIVTVFAAGPTSVSPLTPWDKAARFFQDGADVMAVRREEDDRAAKLLQAYAEHLPYWDAQYRNETYSYRGPQDEELADVVADSLMAREPDWLKDPWLIPLGLGHRDHRLTAEAGLRLAAHLDVDWHVYEELPYGLEDTDVATRKLDLQRQGFTLAGDDSLAFSADRTVKKAAIRCHRSQLRPLRRRYRAAIHAPERVWTLVRQ